MNAIWIVIFWMMGLISGSPVDANTMHNPGDIVKTGGNDLTQGIHQVRINRNPRTVLALEDTHFRPTRGN